VVVVCLLCLDFLLIQTVFELGQVGNGTLFYNFVQSPTPSNPSWQVVHNDLCPTGNVNAPCRYVFLDDGAKQQFWVVTNNFCCLAVDTGPVIPGNKHFLFFLLFLIITFRKDVLKSWLYWGTFEIVGELCDK
jgi:hypothetical protein